MIHILLSTFLWNPFMSEDTLRISTSKEVFPGVQIAIDEITDPSIAIKDFEDKGDLSRGMMNAQKNVDDQSVAVIGHMESYVAIPASSLYEFNKVIMISPSATSIDLTRNSYSYIFSAVPNDNVMSKSLAKYFKSKEYKKVLLCYANNSYGKSFANAFEKSCSNLSIEITDRTSFTVGDIREFKNIVAKWENYNFDSVMFIGYLDEVINFVKSVREKINLPIVISETGADQRFIDSLGDLAEGVVMPLIFDQQDPKSKPFVDKYFKRFKRKPDFSEAISYDLVYMLSKAVKETGSYISADIIEYIKRNPYSGIVQNYQFDGAGNLVVKDIGLQSVENKTFKYLGNY